MASLTWKVCLRNISGPQSSSRSIHNFNIVHVPQILIQIHILLTTALLHAWKDSSIRQVVAWLKKTTHEHIFFHFQYQFLSLYCFIETRSLYISPETHNMFQAALELTEICLPQPPDTTRIDLIIYTHGIQYSCELIIW